MSPPPLSPEDVDNLRIAIEKEFLNATKGFDGVCFRNVKLRYADPPTQLLSTEWSKKKGGRYNPERVPMLYLSCDPHTCLEEAIYVLEKLGVPVSKIFPRVMYAIRVRVSKILDLTDSNVRKALDITESELKTDDDWFSIQKSGGEAVTQTIGRLAYEAGFEALRVPSARFAGENLNLYSPDNLLPTSLLEVVEGE